MNIHAMTHLIQKPQEIQQGLQEVIRWTPVKAYVVGGQETSYETNLTTEAQTPAPGLTW